MSAFPKRRAFRAGLLISASLAALPALAEEAIDEVVVQSTAPARFDLPNDSSSVTA